MDVIRHDDEGMEIKSEPISAFRNRLDDEARHARVAEPHRACGGPVEKCFCLPERPWIAQKDKTRGKAAVQAESNECRMVEQVNVRQATPVECHGYSFVGAGARSSHLFLRDSARKGVTLLEMLVVVGIVAILMGVSYPSIAASIDSVRLATAADSTAAFINSAINRAEQRHQVLELTIAKRPSQITLRSADPTFLRKLELPTGVRITDILPVSLAGEDEARVFYLIPGGAAPRVGVALVNARGAKRTVRVDPITGAPEIER